MKNVYRITKNLIDCFIYEVEIARDDIALGSGVLVVDETTTTQKNLWFLFMRKNFGERERKNITS